MSEYQGKQLKALQCRVLASSGGYSKWCRVKIYEVGKAHLGIVLRIVFDPSRPLRKPPNPNLNHCVHQQWEAEEGSGRDFLIFGTQEWGLEQEQRVSNYRRPANVKIYCCH